MDSKLLSIIIPSYNMEKYLSQCLNSLIIDLKLLEKIEILIINDGSSDSTSEIAHSYEEQYPTVFHCIDKENGNYGSCINRGLKEAKGTYIKILDADDSFDKNNFQTFVNYINLQGEGADLIFTDFCKVDVNGRVLQIITYPFEKEKYFFVSDLPENINVSMWMHAVTYKTENLRKLHYKQTEGISYTDQEWIFLPMANVKTVTYFPHVVYKYLVGRDGQTMNPEAFCRNMWMEIKGTKVMVEEYEQGRNSFSPETLPYLTRQITKRVTYIYRWFLQFYPKQLNRNDLREFDNYLKYNSPYLYKKVEKEAITYKFIRFYYIRDFRAGRKIVFIIFDKINKTKRIILKFLQSS